MKPSVDDYRRKAVLHHELAGEARRAGDPLNALHHSAKAREYTQLLWEHLAWEEEDRAKAEAQQREPDETRRCEAVTGGGRYRCKYDAGHGGRHMAAGTYTTWSDP